MDGAFEARMAVRESIWIVSTCDFTGSSYHTLFICCFDGFAVRNSKLVKLRDDEVGRIRLVLLA